MPGNTLVVQDDRRLVPILRAALASPPPEREANPVFVADPAEALASLDRRPFNVAIVDPRLGGGGMIGELVAVAPELTIVALCEWDETLVGPELEPGAHHYLPKDELTERALWRAIDAARTISNTQQRLAATANELEAGNRELALSLATTHELEDMIALLAHDLPAPLRSARVFADRARDDPVNSARWLSRMDASLEEAVELVRTVLMEHRRRTGPPPSTASTHRPDAADHAADQAEPEEPTDRRING